MDIIVINEQFEGSFENQIEQSLVELKNNLAKKQKIKSIIKLNFFVRVESDAEFSEIKDIATNTITKMFSGSIPAFTIIGQSLQSGNDILIEGYYLKNNKGVKIERFKLDKHPYVVVSFNNGKRRELYSGGITINKSKDFIFDCQNVFDFAEQLLMKENLNFGNIIKQWNYIPSISSVNKFGDNSLQNNKILNAIRDLYYNSEVFENGFTTATEIGANCGSVTIDFVAADKNND